MVLRDDWGKHNGKEVCLFTIINDKGASIQLTNFGARVTAIKVPDREGKNENVVLGFPALGGYLTDECYIGATIGPFANRIANGAFYIDGVSCFLEKNEKNNNNHSGSSGFHNRVFGWETYENTVAFSLFNNDGNGGFPGNLAVSVIYTWSNSNELFIRYNAHTDRKTIVNLTNHSYFNLSGGKDNILLHELEIDSNEIIEIDEDYIPTGKIIKAGNKGFHHHLIKDRLWIEGNKMIGSNDCYIIRPGSTTPACNVWEKVSGRTLNVFTSYPGLLLYTGDFLVSSTDGYQGRKYRPFDGLALECQYYPDSPNHDNFPSVVLDVNEVYDEYIKFSFGIK